MPDGQIVVDGLTKVYKNLRAVDDLSFTVQAGRVTGFLGPNGAGKTTTLRMLLNLVQPTAGTATIGGRRYADLPEPIREVGAILEASAAHKGRTGRNHLRVLCRAAGLPKQRADEVLALVGLTPAANRKFKGYSLGMRQRLGIAAALLGDPRVLVLDEPANGLDPEGIRWMRDLLKALAADGRTVLVSSHLLTEMEILADDVVIIASGKLVAQGTVAAVIDSMPATERTLVRTRRPRPAARRAGRPGLEHVHGERRLHLRTGRPGDRRGGPARRGGVASVGHRASGSGRGLPRAHQGRGRDPMTTLASPALSGAKRTGTTPGRLIGAEILKVRTTNAWWLFTIGVVVFTLLALAVNWLGHHFELHPPISQLNADQQRTAEASAALARTPSGLAKITADMLTSGQMFGCLLALVLGSLVVTNEFYHQTATATFMTTPHRTAVLLAKLVAAALFGAVFWAVSTVLDIVATPVFLHSEHVSYDMFSWIPMRSVLLNLLAFVLWAAFGCGLGALIRNQIGAVITGVVVYLIGSIAIQLLFQLLHVLIPHDWVLTAQVAAPGVASRVLLTPGRAFDHAPPQWAGGVVLVAYAAIFTVIGIALTRKRDIS